ncbi:N-acetylmuramoyl-L-alanine amidase [Flavobacteriaceae bacterium MAR_2010_188]|nr:N-acetylmuramoyl-L-alanine amidase [Flavobacteriaceae bacterium MAR_2010_188]
MSSKILKFQFILVMAFFVSCGPSKSIIQKPIIFDQNRKDLSLEYLSSRYGITQQAPTIVPKMIVLHWTEIETFQDSYNAFYNPLLPNARPELKDAGSLNVSAHFLVDRDGLIYQLLPETTMARHTIGLNHCAIGIENVGGTKITPLTESQLKANIWLVKYLSNKYDIDYLIGHSEYTLFEDSPLWLEKDKSYRTVKTDPGDDFMSKVRAKTKKFNFKDLPKKN